MGSFGMHSSSSSPSSSTLGSRARWALGLAAASLLVLLSLGLALGQSHGDGLGMGEGWTGWMSGSGKAVQIEQGEEVLVGVPKMEWVKPLVLSGKEGLAGEQ